MCGQLLRIIDLIDQRAHMQSFIAVANLIVHRKECYLMLK